MTWSRLRLGAGLLVLALLVRQLGTGPFLRGLRDVDATALVLALVIAVPTTVACAWRWSLISRRAGLALPLGTATAAYFRSQLLNSTLPGGVLGDVHRAVRQGRASPVVLDRLAGQVVQVAVASVALVATPSGLPLRGLALGVAVVVVPLAVLALVRWPAVVVASLVAVTGHLLTFVVAARTAGVTAPVAVLVPLGLVVLVAMGVPANVAGWGPREGVAAWAFATAGLGAGAGLATAVVYGVMALVAALPGLVVLVVDRRAVPAPVPAKEPVRA